jgi:hypothetical protein
MPKLRRLSGAEVIAILGRFGFTVHSQVTSELLLGNEAGRLTQDGPTRTSVQLGMGGYPGGSVRPRAERGPVALATLTSL